MDTRRAAYWLRYLHNINTVPFADHLRGKSLESRLEGLLATAGRLGLRRDLASKVAVVFDYLKNVAKESRYVLVHSDFAPQHVFLDGKVTSVIDLENLQIGPRAIDFAAFCASIDTMLLPPSSSPYAKLAKSELFQSTAEEIGEEVVRGFYTSIMVEKWVNIMQRLAGGCAPSTYAGLAYLARRILRNVRLSCDERFP
jgi:aminoglycoside phosphotransferase (APT) family kinase protein